MSLLTACQDASSGIGLAKLGSIIGNTNKQAEQLLYFAQREIYAERDDFDWQQLISEGSVTGDGTATALSLPADLFRIVSDTTWDRSDNRMAAVGIDSQEWAYLKGWDIVTTLNRRARVIGNQLEFYQPVPNAREIHFEYISKNLVDTSAGGAPKEKFTVDTDVTLIDEDLLTLGIIWRYRKAKEARGWRDDLKDYEKKKMLLQGFQKAPRTLNPTTGRARSFGVQVKDQGFGQ